MGSIARLLGDSRAESAEQTINNIYASATDPEKFHKALIEGDLKQAAEHSQYSLEELQDGIDQIRFAGESMTRDHL